MPVRAERLATALVLGLTASFCLVNGCSLDFTVRPDPGDATIPQETGSDTGLDAGANDADVSVVDATTDGSGDCTTLTNDLEAKLKAARACMLASGMCLQTVKDQCDCDVVIATPGSGAAIAYADAVSKLKNAKCPLGCGGSCPLTTNRNCLQKGTIVECFPP